MKRIYLYLLVAITIASLFVAVTGPQCSGNGTNSLLIAQAGRYISAASFAALMAAHPKTSDRQVAIFLIAFIGLAILISGLANVVAIMTVPSCQPTLFF